MFSDPAVQSARLSSTGHCKVCWAVPVVSSWGKAERITSVHHGEEKAWRDLIRVCKYQKGRFRENRARLFTVVLCDRVRGNGHRLKHRRDLRDIFILRMTEHWHWVERLESPCLDSLCKSIWPWFWVASPGWLEKGVWTRWAPEDPPKLNGFASLWTKGLIRATVLLEKERELPVWKGEMINHYLHYHFTWTFPIFNPFSFPSYYYFLLLLLVI